MTVSSDHIRAGLVFLEARDHWELRNPAPALAGLQKLLGSDESAFYLTPAEVSAYADLSFENAVTSILLEEGPLYVSWDRAFERLWRALPAQYLVRLLMQRSLDPTTDARIRDLCVDAARQGLLSENDEDYDVSGRVVVNADAHPELVAFLGGADFLAAMRQAEADGAWSRFVALHPEHVALRFFYSAFHAERPMLGEMVLMRLERIADCHETFLRAALAQLREADRSTHAELVRYGMRIQGARDPSACIHELHEALVTRTLEDFVARYYPA